MRIQCTLQPFSYSLSHATFILNTVAICSLPSATPRVNANAWAVLTVCLIARPLSSMAASASMSNDDESELAMPRNCGGENEAKSAGVA